MVKNIEETQLLYNFTFKLTMFCERILTINLSAARWHEAQKYHPLTLCYDTPYAPATLILAVSTPFTGCFTVVLTLRSHCGRDKKTTTYNLLASLLSLVVAPLCSRSLWLSRGTPVWRRLSVSWKSLILLLHQECYASLQLLKHKPREDWKKKHSPKNS